MFFSAVQEEGTPQYCCCCCQLGKEILQAGFQIFTVRVWQLKKRIGRSIGCTPQCEREVRPYALNPFLLWKSVSRSDPNAEIKISPHAPGSIRSPQYRLLARAFRTFVPSFVRSTSLHR